MPVVGSLTYDTKIDNKNFEKGLNSIKSFYKNFEKGLNSIKSSTIAVGNIMADAFRNIATNVLNVSKNSIKLASDLQEVQNVVDTTFGPDASKINKKKKNAQTAFGLSELTAKKFNGTMGAMLKSMGLTEDKVFDMSTSMTGLAGDFASFYNLKHEEAFEKIRSGISRRNRTIKTAWY